MNEAVDGDPAVLSLHVTLLGPAGVALLLLAGCPRSTSGGSALAAHQQNPRGCPCLHVKGSLPTSSFIGRNEEASLSLAPATPVATV